MRVFVAGLVCVLGGTGCWVDLSEDPPSSAVPRPSLGPAPRIVTAETPPPPISGGTLLVTSEDVVVAADPDRDAIWVVPLETRTVHRIDLEPRDEPGRVVEDDAGRVHVALRAGGAIVTVDPRSATVISRRPVCAAPRGIAFDADASSLLVACVGGDLVELAADGTREIRRTRLDDDLRDVVIDDTRVLVSRFRTAEVIVVSRETHEILDTIALPGLIANRTVVDPETFATREEQVRFRANLAWRMVAAPGGGALVLHQRAQASALKQFRSAFSDSPTAYYGGGDTFDESCGAPIVNAALTRIRAGSPVERASVIENAVLPVDVAVEPSGGNVAIVAAGNDPNPNDDPLTTSISNGVFSGSLETLVAPGCGVSTLFGALGDARLGVVSARPGQPIAVASTSRGWVVQSREPAMLFLSGGVEIPLGGESRADSGHAHFHRAAGVAMACASCHAEGGDDAHVWVFEADGPRRTQSFRGGLSGTEPLHWDGRLDDFGALVDEVMIRRMGAPDLWDSHQDALRGWVDTIPLLPQDAPPDVAAVARGEALFHSDDVGCASCHSGEALTNNETVFVGTGRELQVPTLRGIGLRAPYLHNGCAQTLHDRFGTCGGEDDHGQTSTLTPGEIDDLVAYLETL